MGRSFGISCRECDYRNNFMVGIGMSYDPQSMMDVESEFALLPSLIRSKKALDQIKELINEKSAKISGYYGHEVYRCHKCGEFYERFFIRLDYEGGSFVVKYKCPKCRVNLKPIDENLGKVSGWAEKKINLEMYPCPKCGKHSLYEGGPFNINIMWD